MDRQISSETELNDMMECSICTEVFTDPRVLPCMHTFCLSCLQHCARNKQPGDAVRCPLCRIEFTIPDDGLEGTQKNHVMSKLIRVRKQKEASTCERHRSKKMELFCVDCKEAVCAKCCSESHKCHNLSDIEKVRVDLKNTVKSETAKISELLSETEETLLHIEKNKNDLIIKFDLIEAEINQTADRLIDSVQQDRRKLLSEVESIRHKQVEQVETAKQELEQHKAALDSFTVYSEVLLSSETAYDVARSVGSLQEFADELSKFDVTGREQSSQTTTPVTFRSSSHAFSVNREARNLVGDLIGGEDVAVIVPAGNQVGAVTSLGDDVFVVRWNIGHVEVYDAIAFVLRCCIAVPGLGLDPLGLAACAHYKCLYISDFRNDRVHKVDLSTSKTVMKWSVARQPVGLFVNDVHSLLVVSQGERKLQEFTTAGILLHNVELASAIQRPQHVVQLSTDKFLVSHLGSQPHVCQADATGTVVRSCSGPKGSDKKNMMCPSGLAVDAHGNILVADTNNNRLLVLDPAMSSAQEMSVCVDGGLKQPRSLHYDKSRRRLYIGEWEGGRVVSTSLQSV